MARGSSTRNPIYVSLGKAKPLEGFRFFLICDYVSKVCVNLMIDNKEINAANSEGYAGGFCGRIMRTLIEGCLCFPGSWYKIMADNYYNTVEFCVWLRNTMNMLIGGTMQRKHTPAIVHIGTAKRPKPSIANPKGILRIAENHESTMYIYSWMDSSLVFFIDPMFGPARADKITRKGSGGEIFNFTVPLFILMYNLYMHAVDVFDQIRKAFGVDLQNATRKYTVRVFEILWSMCLAQSYIVYRHVHKGNPQRQLGQIEFKIAVFRALLRHPVVNPVPEHDPNVFAVWRQHRLMMHAVGTRGDGNRRMAGECRNCPNLDPLTGKRKRDRQTVYYCDICKIALHPECHIPYHERLIANGMTPPSRTLTPKTQT